MNSSRFFTGSQSTYLCCVLAACCQPRGFAPAYYRRRFRPGEDEMKAWQLQNMGLVEERKSGPRGGRRWHATELGEVFFHLIKIHGPKYKHFAKLFM